MYFNFKRAYFKRRKKDVLLECLYLLWMVFFCVSATVITACLTSNIFLCRWMRKNWYNVFLKLMRNKNWKRGRGLQNRVFNVHAIQQVNPNTSTLSTGCWFSFSLQSRKSSIRHSHLSAAVKFIFFSFQIAAAGKQNLRRVFVYFSFFSCFFQPL